MQHIYIKLRTMQITTKANKTTKSTGKNENWWKKVFQFMQEHSETQTRLKYGIGHKRYNKIKEFHGEYSNKKRQH